MFGADEKLTSRVFRLYSHKLHKQRLVDIKSKLSTRINNSVPRTLKYQQIKRTGYMSQVKERKSNINRENEKIFQMITQISGGKRGSSIQYIIETTRQSPKPKSLNLPTRKKEAQRIIEENYALAQRLSESTRGVSFKKFDEDWSNTTRYLNSISKRNIRKLPKIDELNKHLPSFASSEIGSKKLLMLKSPLGFVEKAKSNFSPNLTSPFPGSVIEVEKEEELKETCNKVADKILKSKTGVQKVENKEIVEEKKIEAVKENIIEKKDLSEIVEEEKNEGRVNYEKVEEKVEKVDENTEKVEEKGEIEVSKVDETKLEGKESKSPMEENDEGNYEEDFAAEEVKPEELPPVDIENNEINDKD